MRVIRPEILELIDWDDGDLSPDGVKARLGDAFIASRVARTLVGPPGRPRVVNVWLVAFDANRVRNSDAHSFGHHAGFLPAIRSSLDDLVGFFGVVPVEIYGCPTVHAAAGAGR